MSCRRTCVPLVCALPLAALVAGHAGGRGDAATETAADARAACARVARSDRRPLLFSRAFVDKPVWRARLDAGSRKRVPGVTGGRGLALSPRGCQVAYVKARLDDNGDEIWVADVDGTHATRIGGDGSQMDSPAWSSDGTRVAVAINGGGLGVLDAGGATLCAGSERPRCAVTPPDLVAQTPAWSPVSTRLVFAGAPVIRHPRPDQAYVFDLYEINADGSGMRRLTNSRGVSEYQPAWSPDERLLAFRTERRLGLWVMRAAGQGRRRITRGDDSNPAFSPDGRFIYFVRHTPASDQDKRRVPAGSRQPGLYKIPVRGGRPRLLLRRSWTDLSVAPRWP